MKRFIPVILMPVLIASLAGCTDESRRIRADWEERKATVIAEKSPGRRYLLLIEYDYGARYTCGPPWNQDDDCIALARSFADESEAMRQPYLIKALSEGHPEALRAAFDNKELFAKPVLDALMEEVRRDKGNPLARYYAGRILAEGVHVTRNSKGADALFSAAWPTVAQAADAAAQNALAYGNAEAAYKWAIRCITPCTRTVKLETIAKEIGADRATAIEADERNVLRSLPGAELTNKVGDNLEVKQS